MKIANEVDWLGSPGVLLWTPPVSQHWDDKCATLGPFLKSWILGIELMSLDLHRERKYPLGILFVGHNPEQVEIKMRRIRGP